MIARRLRTSRIAMQTSTRRSLQTAQETKQHKNNETLSGVSKKTPLTCAINRSKENKPKRPSETQPSTTSFHLFALTLCFTADRKIPPYSFRKALGIQQLFAFLQKAFATAALAGAYALQPHEALHAVRQLNNLPHIRTTPFHPFI